MLKLQRILIGLFILLIPIIYPLHDISNSRDFQEAIFQYGVMIVSVFFVRNIWLAGFFCWAVFLYYLNGHTDVGHSTVLNIFLGIILYGISRQLYSKVKFEKECRWMLYLGAISIAFMVMQYFHIDPLHIQMTNDGRQMPFQTFSDLSGVFALKAHNGIFLALLLPIVTLLHPIFGILMLALIKTAESSGAMLAGGVALLFFLWFDKRRIYFLRWSFRWFSLVLILGLLGMGFFFIKDYKASPKMYGARFGIWHLTFKQSLFRPIGYGPDSFRSITPHKDFMIMGDQDFHPALGLTTKDPGAYQFIYYSPDQGKMAQVNDKKDGYKLDSPNIWDHPHNEYLNLLFCFGFPGLFLFLFFIREQISKFMVVEKTPEIILITSMLLVFYFSSLVQFPMSVARLGYLFPIICGAFDAVVEPK